MKWTRQMIWSYYEDYLWPDLFSLYKTVHKFLWFCWTFCWFYFAKHFQFSPLVFPPAPKLPETLLKHFLRKPTKIFPLFSFFCLNQFLFINLQVPSGWNCMLLLWYFLLPDGLVSVLVTLEMFYLLPSSVPHFVSSFSLTECESARLRKLVLLLI